LSLFSNFPQKVEQKIVMDISRNVSQIKWNEFPFVEMLHFSIKGSSMK
jgi:hypothetical protein